MRKVRDTCCVAIGVARSGTALSGLENRETKPRAHTRALPGLFEKLSLGTKHPQAVPQPFSPLVLRFRMPEAICAAMAESAC